ncbi:MAG: hypothetical protein R3E98_08715 [Gemmatimonadota bacterium]
MPSDNTRVQQALAALAPAIEPFETALAATIEELRGFLDAHRQENAAGERVGAELGRFAAARIDPERFSSLIAPPTTTDVETLHVVERALDTLQSLRQRGTDLFWARVTPGGDLRTTVTDALADAGRAFGVARALRFVWNGVPTTSLDDPRDPFPPSRWNPAERALAPPLVVEVGGRDVSAAGLADLLEGRQKVILVVEGPAPVAPLARLLTPDLLVAQVGRAEALAEVGRWSGPAVAAWMEQGGARFVHRPGGASFRTRVQEEEIPDAPTGRVLGRVAAAREANDLEHLRELLTSAPAAAQVPVITDASATGTPDAAVAVPTAAPADRLAGWLLAQAGLAGGA